jgi:gamma-glutamyl hydrolase
MTLSVTVTKLLLLLSISFILSSCQSNQTLNLRPIIGILTLPSEFPDVYNPANYSYLAASYVKFVEAGGARVVPVQYDLPQENLTTLFSYLNGWLFTGGSEDLYVNNTMTQYGQTVQYILNSAINASANGVWTPVWGTCQGFQYIAYLLSQNNSIGISLTTLDNVAMNLTWNTTNFQKSRTFQNLPSDLYTKLTTNELVFFAAQHTIDPNAWSENPTLAADITPIAYVPTSDGIYVAYIEGTNAPIYASQFHPEKVTFEWDEYENIPHSFDAIRFEQYLGNWFANETRKNLNQFPNETYAATFVAENFNTTILNTSSFQQIYVFQNVNYTSTEAEYNVNPNLLNFLAANPVWESSDAEDSNDEL